MFGDLVPLSFSQPVLQPADFAANRGTAAAAATRASVRRSMVVHSGATDGMSASKCQGIWPHRMPDCRPGAWNGGRGRHRAPVLREYRKSANIRAIPVLAERGYRAPSGKQYSAASVASMVSDPA